MGTVDYIMSSLLIHRGDSLSFTVTNEYAIKTMNCPAYEDWNQPTSEDHTYECILFHPEDKPQQDSNGLYDN